MQDVQSTSTVIEDIAGPNNLDMDAHLTHAQPSASEPLPSRNAANFGLTRSLTEAQPIPISIPRKGHMTALAIAFVAAALGLIAVVCRLIAARGLQQPRRRVGLVMLRGLGVCHLLRELSKGVQVAGVNARRGRAEHGSSDAVGEVSEGGGGSLIQRQKQGRLPV